jgi:hypothetical protein
MLARSVLNHILDDEGLTRHLGDAEARLLVEWLVDEAEWLAQTLPEAEVAPEVQRLCRRGRVMARFVRLWSIEAARGPAAQLVATERTDWPLPDGPIEAWELMWRLVRWESHPRVQ